MPIHIKAEKKDVNPYVLLPGDPDRADYVAHKYLKKVKLYSSYRKMLGFSGTFEGVPVSVQTSGMGTPSAAIVVSELYQIGVEAITRIGTMGGLQKNLKLADLIIVNSAWGSREIVSQITQINDFAPAPSFELVGYAVKNANAVKGLKFHVGPILSHSLFYEPNINFYNQLSALGCYGCEMEAAALFALAAVNHRKASCLLTVSDLIYGKKSDFVRASEEKILDGVDKMVKVALASFVDLHQEKKLNFS